jgi:hypothetical protein
MLVAVSVAIGCGGSDGDPFRAGDWTDAGGHRGGEHPDGHASSASDAADDPGDADGRAPASDAAVDSSGCARADGCAPPPSECDAGTCRGIDGSPGTEAGGTDATPCSTIFYRDADEDGFGNPHETKTACTAPEGYVGNADDCYDANADAKPGQETYFDEDRGDGSFDYDCVGGGEAHWTAIGTCGGFPACVLSAGWVGNAPECGKAASWMSGCTGLAALCSQQTEERKQECR